MEFLKAIFFMSIGAGITLLIVNLLECEGYIECRSHKHKRNKGGFNPATGYGDIDDDDNLYTGLDINEYPERGTAVLPRRTETFSRR